MAAERGKSVTGSLTRHVMVMSLSGAIGLSFTFLVDFLALWWISRLRVEARIAAVGIAGTILAFIFTGALFVANATFNNLARPLWSTAANWFRDGLPMLPAGMALAALAGAEGIVRANARVNVIAGTVAARLAWRYIWSLNRPQPVAAAAA